MSDSPAQRANVVVHVGGLVKTYDRGRITVLDGVDLDVRAGELVALWGASGSGKSTLLHLIGGLDVPDSGDLVVCGRDPRLETDRLALRRGDLGFVFQLHNLIPDLTVRENIRVPGLAAGVSAAACEQRVRELAGRMGIGHRLDHRIQDLSGGERQRTAICRALFHAPKLVLADEPTGSLDEATGDTVFGLLKELAERDGIAVILATHERRFAEQCHRRIRVRAGKVAEE